MANVRVLVLRAPGTNCYGETCHAFKLAGATPIRVHVNSLLESPHLLRDYQIFVVPGGFSYGDDVAAGKILANQLRIGLAAHLRAFLDSGKLILGICNGFQVLIKSGLLPGWADTTGDFQPATLAANDSGRFEDRWITMDARSDKCVFLGGISRLELPIAHGEGKFVCRERSLLERLDRQGQIVLQFADPGGSSRAGEHDTRNELLPYPINPNGSEANIAGICDTTGRVFGLMPHPERYVHFTQHPRWTRMSRDREGDGLAIFRNAVGFFS